MGDEGRAPRAALTIDGLLRTPHLGLSLFAGETGRDRAVGWVHVSDLDEPAAWLDGGELLITNGLSLPRNASAQVEYLSSLAEVRAAGLAIGVRNPPLTTAFRRRSDELGFPVLRISRETPFLAVSKFVAAANQDAAHRRLLTQVRLFDALRHRATGDFDPVELFRHLERLSGYTLFVVGPTGRPWVHGMPHLPDHLVPYLKSMADRTPSVPGGYAVQVPVDRSAEAYLVALERHDADPAGLGAVRHIATIAALELAYLLRDREQQRRQGAETLAELLAGRLSQASAERRLGGQGFKTQTPLAIAALRAHGVDIDAQIHHRLCDLGTPHLMLVQDEMLLVIPAEADELTPAIHDLPVHAGISEPRIGLGEWAVARREATWALHRAVTGPPGRVVRYSDSDSVAHWIPSDITVLRELTDRVLGSLRAYDVEHKSSMLHTLNVFFANERRHAPTAEALFIHKHTLSYRLRRIEEIAGRSLHRMEDLTDFWLALRGLDVLGEPPTDAAMPRDDDHAAAGA
jgi:purine catabolism regulator